MTTNTIAVEIVEGTEKNEVPVGRFIWVFQTTKPVRRFFRSWKDFPTRVEALQDWDAAKEFLVELVRDAAGEDE